MHLMSNTLPLVICGILVIKLNPVFGPASLLELAVWWFGGLGFGDRWHRPRWGLRGRFWADWFFIGGGHRAKTGTCLYRRPLCGPEYGTALLTTLPIFTEGTNIIGKATLVAASVAPSPPMARVR